MSAKLPGGGVFFSGRAEGNMSSVGGLGAERGAENRERLRVALGLDGLARIYQVHGNRVLRVGAPTGRDVEQEQLERADGQATTLTGLGVMAMAADCLPVALGTEGAVAIVHAGWRGLAAGALEEGVAALHEIAGEEEMAAVIGPCAGACCYEVGPEVHEALVSEVRDKGLIDLRAIARERLRASGVARIENVGGCTICDESYFSYRREGASAGRMAAVAWLS
jgi:polyphenol oxidase